MKKEEIKNNRNIIIGDILKIIISYLVLLFVTNINLFARKILFSAKGSYTFISVSLIISIIILSLCIVFKKMLFKRKVSFWILFLTLIVYNFSEGYFSDFYAYPFLLLYIYLLTLTFCIMLKRIKRFEIAMPAAFSLLIISAFIFGMFGILCIFKYFMLITFILMILYIRKIYKRDKNKFKIKLDNFLDSGFIIFNILWMLAMLFGAGLYVHSYDEYSHWAYDAKAMIYYSKFGTSQEIMLKTRGYPPIFTVWHYIVSIFRGFSEHNLYVGLNMLIMVYLLPAFYYIKNNNIITKILGFIAIVYGCYIFGGVYGYTSLYVDLAISVIFGSIIMLYFVSKDEKINLDKLIMILLIILTLSKTNGFVISTIALLIIFINEIINSANKSIKDLIIKTFNILKKYKYYILTIIISYILWKAYLFITSKITVDYYDFILLPKTLMGDLKYKLNYDFTINFIKKILNTFDDKFVGGILNFSLYQFLIINIMVLFILFYNLTNSIKKAMLKLIPFIISYLAFFIITVISMYVALSVYEASQLASFSRYLDWYNVALIIFEVFIILKLLDEKNFLFKNLVLTYIVLCIPFITIFGFVINPARGESYNVSINRSKKVKLVNKYTPKNSLIYVIDQKDKDGIMAMWYSRYYTFPRKNNASSLIIGWKIKTSKNKYDLKNWGFTAEKWAKHLKKYKFEYVFLYSKDNAFFKETEFLYDDVNMAKKYNLFKIENSNKKIKLIPIK